MVCVFAYRAVTCYGRTFQTVRLTLANPTLRSYDPALSLRIARFRLFRFRSPLLSESRLVSLPLGTEMVHFPRFASHPYVFRMGSSVFARMGFPHSDIPGSRLACSSPRLIAADHVLHRLLAPRHPHTCP